MQLKECLDENDRRSLLISSVEQLPQAEAEHFWLRPRNDWYFLLLYSFGDGVCECLRSLLDAHLKRAWNMWIGYLYILLLLVSETEPYWNYFKSHQLAKESTYFRVEREFIEHVFSRHIIVVKLAWKYRNSNFILLTAEKKRSKNFLSALFHKYASRLRAYWFFFLFANINCVHAEYVLIGKTGRDRCSIAYMRWLRANAQQQRLCSLHSHCNLWARGYIRLRQNSECTPYVCDYVVGDCISQFERFVR